MIRGPGTTPPLHRVPHRPVHRAPEALHRREAGFQHPDAVLEGVERIHLGWIVAGVPAVLAEMPVQVDVGVDEPGKDGAAGEIEALTLGGQLGFRQDCRDPVLRAPPRRGPRGFLPGHPPRGRR